VASVVTAVLLLGAAARAAEGLQSPAGLVVQSAFHDFKVESFVDGLVHPFAMAFTPDGDMLVTERPGRPLRTRLAHVNASSGAGRLSGSWVPSANVPRSTGHVPIVRLW
jgi:glucose/arabinose dehydrogenase